ncbi:Cellulose synthase-like protein D3 [Carex littledalei]|uniref:Cellulose synthase-like protein D3 n=1 Tax=Carex littledalei TaxID=544730 RepID=A0A833QIW8_9POAL|nr:Cellulose synthase-like protein D3 [Carex littledalei]
MVAYEACNRLCMNACKSGCTQVAEFLQDECVVLRNAFGIQKFLLQPKGQHSYVARISYEKEATSNPKGKKVIEKIEVEVKKIRNSPQKSTLRNISSLRSFYTQVGYMHAGGTCPSCKEPYRVTDLEEMGNVDADGGTMTLPLPPGAGNKMARRLSLVKSMRRSQAGDWDHYRFCCMMPMVGLATGDWRLGNVDADGGTMTLPLPPGAGNKMARRLSLVKSMRRSQTATCSIIDFVV